MLSLRRMFGIGPGEMIVVIVVLLIAVGPKSMPKLMQALGRGLREFRRATNELRQQVGIDDLMKEEDWRDPLGLKKPATKGPAASPSQGSGLTARDRQREYPPEGVDVRHAAESRVSGPPDAGPEADAAADGEPPAGGASPR